MTQAPGRASTPPPPPPPPPGAPDVVPGPTTPRPYGRKVSTDWGWFARVPLRARLVAIIALLLAAGLGIAALATVTVVSNYLVRQVDEQLRESAGDLASQPFQQGAGTGNLTMPSEYYVLYRFADGQELSRRTQTTLLRYGAPDIPPMSTAEVQAIRDEPFTVGSTYPEFVTPGKSTSWRVLVTTRERGLATDTAFVALPLAGVHETTWLLGRTLALSALGIVLLGSAVAYLAVRRAFRPLREIETTAAGIAGGDLARRIRPAPESTEVGSLAVSLNAMLTQIEQAFAAREASEARMRRFVSDASHELRTPLATVRGYGELYRMGALDTPEKVDDTMSRIEDSATRMGTLVNDLLALARLDEGRPIRRAPVDLAALARDSARDLHALDPTREVRVLDPAGSPLPAAATVPTVGDEDRLRQVLANLIGNVARHTPAGSPAEIVVGATRSERTASGPSGTAPAGAAGSAESTGTAGSARAVRAARTARPTGATAGRRPAEPGTAEPGTAEPGTAEPGTAEPGIAVADGDAGPDGGAVPDDAAVVLEVRDHGPGVTEEQAARIFERFYRADSSRNRASGGSGLGMAIVAAIVGAHHGAVRVLPTPGGGLTVRVTLPARTSSPSR